MSLQADQRIYGLAGQRCGVVRRGDLIAAGVDRGVIERRIRQGVLTAVGRGVYLVPALQTAGTPRQLAVTLVRGSALSHVSAARVHSILSGRVLSGTVHLVGPKEARTPSILRRSEHGRLSELATPVVIHRTKHLPPVDVVEIEGLRVTSVERTLCDLASVLREQRLKHVIEDSLAAGRCASGGLMACRSAYVRRGRVGSARLNLVLDELLDDTPMPSSELERRMQRLLIDFSIAGFVAQFRPEWFDGLRGIVDFAHPGAKVIIEVDGRRWHSVTQAFEEDRRRDRRAQANGWVVLRFSWHEVVHRSAAIAEEIQTILNTRIQR